MKTETVGGHEDQPDFSILEGHVDLETFNIAFKNEGWSSSGFDHEMVVHEYWIKNMNSWTRSKKGAKGAVPVTVGIW